MYIIFLVGLSIIAVGLGHLLSVNETSKIPVSIIFISLGLCMIYMVIFFDNLGARAWIPILIGSSQYGIYNLFMKKVLQGRSRRIENYTFHRG